MTTFIEGHARNPQTGAGVNAATATIKKHADASTIDSVATAGIGADAGNYEFSEAEILAAMKALGASRYPGQFYEEVTFGTTTKLRSSKANGQIGPIRLNDLTRIIYMLGHGIVDIFVDNFAVTAAGTDMNVDIAAGFALGAGQTYFNAAVDEVTISAAHATLPRIDNIVIRFYPIGTTSEHDVGRVDVLAVAGVPDAAPVAPTLTQSTTTFWEERLCTVAVGAAVTTIAQGNITDTRRYVQTDIPLGTNGQYLKLVAGQPSWDTFTSADVTDFDEAVEDKIGTKVIAGAGITVTYDDPGTGSTTITNTAGGAGTIAVQEGDVTVDGTVSTLDFDASDFNVTSSPAGEANISLAYGTVAGTPAEGDHEHSSFQNFEVNASRNVVTDGSTNITSTSGQTISGMSDTMVLSSGVTYDIYVWGHAQLNAPSGQWIEARIVIAGGGGSPTFPWLGTGTVGGERGVGPYAVQRAVVGSGQTITVHMQAKVTGGTGSVVTASFLGQAIARGTGGAV